MQNPDSQPPHGWRKWGDPEPDGSHKAALEKLDMTNLSVVHQDGGGKIEPVAGGFLIAEEDVNWGIVQRIQGLCAHLYPNARFDIRHADGRLKILGSWRWQEGWGINSVFEPTCDDLARFTVNTGSGGGIEELLVRPQVSWEASAEPAGFQRPLIVFEAASMMYYVS